MTVPLMILAMLAVVVGVEHAVDRPSAWTRCCEQAQPAGIAEGIAGGLIWPRRDDAGRALCARRRDQRQGRMGGLRRGAGGFPAGHGVLRPAKAGPRGRPPHVRAALPVAGPQMVVRRIVRLPVRPAGAAHLRLGGGGGSKRASTGWPTIRPGRSSIVARSTIGSTASSSTRR